MIPELNIMIREKEEYSSHIAKIINILEELDSRLKKTEELDSRFKKTEELDSRFKKMEELEDRIANLEKW